ncbi:ABC1 kinase family protein [Aporhodopirellula aestuarii]|uniref:AarF/ABC1/UbiB kinase family protein n=1 Tax=Aporhodopirellula aestuarii TaxID=2950107 RepID=A0ABT0U0W1_9BACT|nr:AarF/ABC1/UbiB kinase family protein [Aporhodopirellula aestuarii]MCM2370195.1 AarF/ABC1/UbiB kinase family protein [Aporhodopirellula aestuarii]
MELTEVPQLFRNADRFREVVTILAKHGLADWISGVPSYWLSRFRVSIDESLTTDERIRIAITQLGTTFIKLGQVLSTRADLVGAELAQEFAQLRENTPHDSAEVAIAMIESELGGRVDELFASFDSEPMASASIGQVHPATLHNGQQVVVKVQHAGIERRIVSDLEIMVKLAEIAEEQSSQLRQYRPVQTMREFQKTLMQELDFNRELRNMNRFRKNFAEESNVRFATPYPELSSRRVLTMERLDGVSISDTCALRACGANLSEIARRGANIFLDMIFRDGFYHADPHPGNLMLLDCEHESAKAPSCVGLLDCGMVGKIDDGLRDDLEVALIASVGRDAKVISEVVARLGRVPADFDEPALVADIQELIDEYSDQTIHDFNISEALRDVVAIIRQHRIYLPSKVAMLLKVLGMLEGTAHQLNPQFSLAELIEPYGKRAMLRRFSPKQLYDRMKSRVDDWDRFFKLLPLDLAEILHSLKQGSFDVHLQHRRLEPIVNRLVMGILTAALFVGSASLWSNGVSPTLFGISLPGVLGCTAAVFMGVRISLAIRRSRRAEND